MGDGNDAVGSDKASLEDVHVLPTDGVVQLEQMGVMWGNFQSRHLC